LAKGPAAATNLPGAEQRKYTDVSRTTSPPAALQARPWASASCATHATMKANAATAATVAIEAARRLSIIRKLPSWCETFRVNLQSVRFQAIAIGARSKKFALPILANTSKHAFEGSDRC
jgi:hypothetical protein